MATDVLKEHQLCQIPSHLIMYSEALVAYEYLNTIGQGNIRHTVCLTYEYN